MTDALQSVLMVGIGVLVIGFIAWLVNQHQKRRIAELAAFAGEMGFRFVEGTVDGGGGFGCLAGLFGMHEPEQFPLMARYEAFHPFGVGHSRICSNLLSGRRGELEWVFFDYRYTTGSGKNSSTHYLAIAGVLMPFVFQGLEIRAASFQERAPGSGNGEAFTELEGVIVGDDDFRLL